MKKARDTTSQADPDKLKALENSLEIKKKQRRDYLASAEQLEAKAIQFRNIAAEISRGIRRTQLAIKRLEKRQ